MNLLNINTKNISSLFSRESGVSLIAVMWIVAILTVLASEFMYSMQLEIRVARNWSDQVSAFYAAKGGLESAIIVLKEDEQLMAETGYDALDEDWAQEIAGEELNNSTYQTTVTDESAKININTIDEETLAKAIIFCMGSSEDKTEEETAADAQALAAAIIEKRPYRTTAEMAKATDMTPELLYGESGLATIGSAQEEAETEGEEGQSTPLVDITTVYSAEKNVTSDGGKRANINGGDANQIQQSINPEGQEIITQQEAQAIVDYGSQQGNNQQGQGGGQQPQMEGQMGEAGQENQSGYTSLSQLLDAPAISQETFNSIQGQISVDSGEDNRDRVNINNASANELQNLDGIDNGIAESIVNYRNQNQFGSVDDIRQVKVVSIEDMKTIADRIALSDDEAAEGKININTTPQEILEILPGMDEEKAQIIVEYRTLAEGQTAAVSSPQQGGQAAGPLTNIGQLMDIEGIDQNTFRGLIDHVSCRSAVFSINSEGQSLDGKIIQSCLAIVDRSGDRIKIKYWKQE